MDDELQLTDVCCAYGARQVLDAVTLSVRRGELLAVLGPSGCGKTTLLRSVAGLVTPSRGTIAVGPRVLSGPGVQVPLRQRRVGLVFQDYALFPDLTVRDNVGFAPGTDRAQVDGLMELAGVEAFADRLPSQLSGGQQQRVALARALAARPDVLLLDEPFANLDPPLRAALGPALRDLVRTSGAAALLVTHDRVDALALSDRVAVLTPSEHGGQLAQVDAPQALFHRPESEAVAQLVGPGWVLLGTAGQGVVQTELGAVPVTAEPGVVRLWVRPDQATFEPDPSGPATCSGRRFVGPEWRVDFRCGELDGVATVAARVPLGTRGHVRVAGGWPLPTDA